jgi:hypothetical protein
MRKDKNVLRAWFEGHVDHPYPSKDEKEHLMEQTGMTQNEVSILSELYSGRTTDFSKRSPSGSSTRGTVGITTVPLETKNYVSEECFTWKLE